MNRLQMKVCLLFGCLFLSFQTMALGLGELTLKSSLNRPLVAEIELVEPDGLSPWEIKAFLASEEVFSEVGVERPFFLTQIKFTVIGNRIRLTTRNAVTEPFLDFLVELNWPSGRVMREYTVLLDPPAFDDSMYQPLAAVPEVDEAAVSEASADMDSNQTTVESNTQASSASNTAARSAPSSNGSVQSGQYRVLPNDTLWAIALKTRPSDRISAQQMMLAIQDENPSAFINGNINRLKSNQVLEIPDENAINSRTFRQAVGEVARQNDMLAGVAQIDATSRAGSRSGARSYGSDGEVRLVTPESDRRSSAGTSGDVGAAGGAGRARALENDLAMALENLDRSRRENAELNSRLKELQEQINSMQRLASLKSDQLTNMQASANVPETAKPAEIAKPANSVAQNATPTQAQPAKPVQDSQPKQRAPFNPDRYKPKAPEPTLIDMLLDPLVLGGIGAVLLAGLGGLFFMKRKKAAEDSKAEEPSAEAAPLAAMGGESDSDTDDLGFGDNSVSLDEQPIESGDLDQFVFQGFDDSPESNDNGGNDFSFDDMFASDEDGSESSEVTLADMEAQEINDLDDVDLGGSGDDDQDPLDLADVCIAYGRYEKAAETLDSAIEADPGRSELRLKRLELMVATENDDGFAEEVAAIQSGFGGAFDDQIEEMRSRLPSSGNVGSDDFNPEEGLDFSDALEFGSEPSIGDEEVSVGQSSEDADALEIDLDDGSLDFDLSDTSEELELTESEEGDDAVAAVTTDLESDDSLDFDMDFDLDISGESETAEVDKSEDSHEFDLELDIPDLDPLEHSVAEEELEADSDIELSFDEMDLDLEDIETVSEETVELVETSVDSAAEPEDVLELNLDDLEVASPESEEVVSVDSGKSSAVDDMDFSLDDLDAELGDLPTVSESTEESAESEFSLDDLDVDLGDLSADSQSESGDGSFSLGDLDSDLGELATAETSDDSAEIEESTFSLDDLDSDLGVLPSDQVEESEESPELAGEEFSLEDLDADLGELSSELDSATAELQKNSSNSSTAEAEDEFSLDDLDMDLDDLATLEDSGDSPTPATELTDSAPSSSEGDLDLDSFAMDLSDDDIELDADNIDDIFGSMSETAEEDSVPELTEAPEPEPELSVDDDLPTLELDDDGSLDLADLDADLEDFGDADSFDLSQSDLADSDEAPLLETESDSSDAFTAVDDEGDDFDFLGGNDECATKLDLARAYVDMGDTDGARDLLDEVITEGSAEQKQEAKALIDSLS